jgi:hypothetical protein
MPPAGALGIRDEVWPDHPVTIDLGKAEQAGGERAHARAKAEVKPTEPSSRAESSFPFHIIVSLHTIAF